MTVGQRIKRCRVKKGISVDQLAEMLNKNRATIYRYENGDIENLPITILEPIASALNTTPQYLMGWTKDDDQESLIDYFYDILAKSIQLIEKKGYKVIESDNTDIISIIDNSGNLVKSLHDGDLVANYEHILYDNLECNINLLLGIKNDVYLSNHEETVINAYRSHPEMQPAVDKILGIKDLTSVHLLPNAAHDIDGSTEEDKKHDEQFWDDFED